MMGPITVKCKKTSTSQGGLFFVISKKNIPKAVDRNRIKRYLRLILTPIWRGGDFEYTVMVRKGAEALSLAEIKVIIQKELTN